MEEKIIYDVEVKGVQSIENLTKANKELREERKKLDLQSEQGLKRAQEINKQLDANTEIIKENSSALEKQRLNVGNYTGALDKLVPGLGATANGFTSMAQTAKAFIVTPIGAVIGALGLAIAALTQYFRDNEEGQNSFNRIMNVGSAIVGKFTDLISFLGENVFKVLISGFETTIGFLEKWVPGFAQATKAVEKFLNLDRADYISDLEAETDALERQLIVRKAQLEAIVAEQKLRAEDKSLSLKERKQALDEASKSQKELNDLELQYAKNKLDIIVAQNAQSNSNKEALKAEAEARANLFRIQKDAADKQKEIFTKNQEIKAQEAALNAKANEQLAEEVRLKNQLTEISERQNEQTDIELPKLELKIKGQDTINKSLDALVKKNQEVSKSEKERVKAAEDSSDKQVKAAIALSAAIIGLGESDTKAKKALGLSTIAINSGIGVSEAIKAGAGKTWPLNLAAILSGITAVLTGITQAKGLLGFASGGLTGTKIMAHHGTRINRSNGDNLLATVKTGEVILNERHQAMLGGDRTFARLGVPGFASGGFVAQTAKNTESISSQIQLYEAISRIQPVVTVEDINAGQSRVSVIQNRAQVI